VVDLTVGVIIGGAFGTIGNSRVNDVPGAARPAMMLQSMLWADDVSGGLGWVVGWTNVVRRLR